MLSDNSSISGSTPLRAFIASVAQEAQLGSLIYDWIKGMITATDVCTDLALEAATAPTGAIVVAGDATGTKRAVFDDEAGPLVIDPAVDDARLAVVEAGEAVCDTLEDPEDNESEPDTEVPETEELPAELTGQ